MNIEEKIKVIAFYLPQFHPIPENDRWWGKGFTEWTNVNKAKPLFKGHDQPKIPADLGYYDLRLPETRNAQADLAQHSGINGFCYWHYWFGEGRRILERPFQEVVESNEPEFPFCLGWANHSWERKTWIPGDDKEVLLKQSYPGTEDHINHFYSLLKAFKDKRYILVDNKPLFVIWAPNDIPDIREFIQLWNGLAKENGLEGIYFVGFSISSLGHDLITNNGFDAVLVDFMTESLDHRSYFEKLYQKILRTLFSYPVLLNYAHYTRYSLEKFKQFEAVLPCINPNFDHTPRSGKRGIVLKDSSPENFGKLLDATLKLVKNRSNGKKIVFIKSWNEWGEGNYLEPDYKYGHQYLNLVKEKIARYND